MWFALTKLLATLPFERKYRGKHIEKLISNIRNAPEQWRTLGEFGLSNSHAVTNWVYVSFDHGAIFYRDWLCRTHKLNIGLLDCVALYRQCKRVNQAEMETHKEGQHLLNTLGRDLEYDI